MKRMLWTRVIVPLAAGSFAAALAGPAYAVNCSSLPGPLYITGSSAVQNFLAGIATALATSSPTGPTIIYSSPGSCNGPDAIFNGTPMTGTATYWPSSGTATTCQLDAAGDPVDIGVSDVYYTSCASSYNFPTPLPATVGSYYGPNQVMNFVVPAASSQAMISAQAAYLVFGFPQGGPAAGVSPWGNTNADMFVFMRGAASGTQSMIAAAINVPPASWNATTVSGGSNGMLAAVANSTSPEATIGILASDVTDVNRSTVHQLAYQHYGQDCAWLPDSSSTAFDKQNVRDGHYAMWGPIHFYTKLGSNGMPVNAQAAALIGYFDGSVAAPFPNGYQGLLQLIVKGHTVPACAMHVQRSLEVGPVSAYTDTAPCNCYFDFVATGATACAACSTDTQCTSASAPKCRYGYCEAN